MKLKYIILGLILISVVLISGCIQTSEGSKDCVSDADCVVFGETGDCNCGCYNKNNLPSSTGGECFCQAPTSCKCINGRCEGVFEEINSFDDCANAGYPVMESYPRQCKTPDGRTFVEKITHNCTEGEKNAEICTMEYAPVCGDNNKTYGNGCMACASGEIDSWTWGGCENENLTIEEAMIIAENSECTEEGNLTNEYMYNSYTKTWWIELDIEKEGCNPACVVSEDTRTAEINWRCTGLLN